MNVILLLCDTLRRDHTGGYHLGRPLNDVFSDEAPSWPIPTPNMDRLAQRGTVFDNAWCGSTPCMPARRDIYTGRLEFLERGWGPLEDIDADLPRQVSGPPNRAMTWSRQHGYKVSALVSDHFHLWEQGSGNYHMGYTGFEFIRGIESDAWRTDPVWPGEDYFCPPGDATAKTERHWRNVHFTRQREADYFAARTLLAAAEWVDRNADHDDFYLHVDCFSPHEPWDPPEELLKLFWPAGYDVDFPGWSGSSGGYAPWKDRLSDDHMNFIRARYAANVVLVDRWLGVLMDVLDRRGLWDETVFILTTDHGTFNGDHGRIGKLQTHEHDACGHIPLIVAHPHAGQGQRRDQLVQLVDLYPTVLSAVGRPLPDFPEDRPLHGVDLLPVLADPSTPTRDAALAGQFGASVTITDGQWILHQSPPDPSPEGNQPLYWYGVQGAHFIPYDLGPFESLGETCRRPCRTGSWRTPTWLSDKRSDPNERVNLADDPAAADDLARMQKALRNAMEDLHAPPEQLDRLALP